MMMKIILVANLVRDAVVNTNKEGEKFTAASVAVERGYGDKKTTIYPEFTVNGEAIAKSLTKGRQVVIIAEDLVSYEYQGKDGTGIGYRLLNANVQLGDVVATFVRGRLTADVNELEGKDFAAPRLLSNVRLGKEKEALVASSLLLGPKYLEKTKPSLKKGKVLNAFGVASLNAYTGKEGPGAEIRFANCDVDLGPDAKAKAEGEPATAETADEIPD